MHNFGQRRPCQDGCILENLEHILNFRCRLFQPCALGARRCGAAAVWRRWDHCKISGSHTECCLRSKRDFTHILSLRSRLGESHTCSRPEKGLCLIYVNPNTNFEFLPSGSFLFALIKPVCVCVCACMSECVCGTKLVRGSYHSLTEDFTKKHQMWSIWLLLWVVDGNSVEHYYHTVGGCVQQYRVTGVYYTLQLHCHQISRFCHCFQYMRNSQVH